MVNVTWWWISAYHICSGMSAIMVHIILLELLQLDSTLYIAPPSNVIRQRLPIPCYLLIVDDKVVS